MRQSMAQLLDLILEVHVHPSTSTLYVSACVVTLLFLTCVELISCFLFELLFDVQQFLFCVFQMEDEKCFILRKWVVKWV